MQYKLFEQLMRAESSCHGGDNDVNVFRAFDAKQDDKQKLDFIDFVQIPPASTIGSHKHGDNREWYFILQGKGQMTFCGEQINVEQGDVLVNPEQGEHSLVNHSNQDILLVVIQFSARGSDGY